MKIEKLENQAVPPHSEVTVKECGNIAVVRHSMRENRQQTIVKISKEHYIVPAEGTGELHTFRHNDNRLDDKQSLRESLARLCDYLNTNVTDPVKCRWLTLTYREVMNDPAKLYRDFKAFNRACRRHYGTYEYIVACEYQKRKSLHLHCVLIFPGPAPFMANDDVALIWGHGFVNVRKLAGVDDIGRYLCAYLGDATLDELERLPANIGPDQLKAVEVEENGTKTRKAVIKGARLALMPPGFHLYRISGGIRKPTQTRMTSEQAESLFEDWALTHEITYKLTDDIRNFTNIINKRFYNRLRGKKGKDGTDQQQQAAPADTETGGNTD